MKKNFWILGMAVAALTSCTQSEVVNVPEGKPIGFKMFVENGTRAVESTLTKDNIADIWVLGYKAADASSFTDNMQLFFDNVNVHKETTAGSTTGAWTYTPLQYWSKNTTYRFAAYADGKNSSSDVTYNPKDDFLLFDDYVAGSKDLLASIPGDRTTDNDLSGEPNVAFNFNHLLAKVQFVFTEQANVYMQVKNLKIANAVNRGDGKYYHDVTSVTGAYSLNAFGGKQGVHWTLSIAENDKGYSFVTSLTPTLALDALDEMFVIPQENTDKKATFELVTYQDAGFTNEINRTSMSIPLTTMGVKMDPNSTATTDIDGGIWRPSRVYRYHITFTASEFDEVPIKFTVNSVAAWDNNLSPDDENDDILPGVTESN